MDSDKQLLVGVGVLHLGLKKVLLVASPARIEASLHV
jgi:hypothetical protein